MSKERIEGVTQKGVGALKETVGKVIRSSRRAGSPGSARRMVGKYGDRNMECTPGMRQGK